MSSVNHAVNTAGRQQGSCSCLPQTYRDAVETHEAPFPLLVAGRVTRTEPDADPGAGTSQTPEGGGFAACSAGGNRRLGRAPVTVTVCPPS